MVLLFLSVFGELPKHYIFFKYRKVMSPNTGIIISATPDFI